MKMHWWLVLALVAVAAMEAGAQARFDAEAVRLNNRGVAQMSQQVPERAAVSFADAFKKDPTMAQAAINAGIALMARQKLDEAKKYFEQALALDPRNAQAWYNEGLAQHAENEIEPALKSFQQAVAINPRDADSLYFEGVCYQDMKDLDKVIAIMGQVLVIDPLHASAEFALARALQRSGHTAEARTHFQRFQHLTGTKIGVPIGLSYGEQGRYSSVLPVEEPETAAKPGFKMSLSFHLLDAATKQTTQLSGGACMLDVTGQGTMDLVLTASGAQAIEVLHRDAGGSFDELNPESTGLVAHGHAVACAVGDYDGDGLNDLAVALDDSVLLFRNLGHGRFQNVTAESGLLPRNHPSGITFVDYDHDGDLDLLLTGAPLAPGGTPNILWRNNGNGTFTEWTEPTGLGGHGKTSAAILTDFNNDRAVDLVVTGDGAAPLIYVNPREGKYPVQPLYEDAKLPPTVGIAVLDYNKDGWMDIAVTHAGAINWGLVAGKSQTYLPWDSWQFPYVVHEPTVWFHDIFHTDGTPYREKEVEIIRSLTAKQ